jgi:hypothetical protein
MAAPYPFASRVDDVTGQSGIAANAIDDRRPWRPRMARA